jgi:ankyrin repeat protein
MDVSSTPRRVPNADFQNDDEWTALLIASRDGNLDIVDLLIKAGVNLHIRNKYGGSAIYVACQNGHIAIVEYLLKNGSNVEDKNKAGWTPLFTASEKGHLNVVDVLVKNHAKTNHKDETEWTALQYASRNNHLAIVECLINGGAFVNERNKNGSTALHIACEKGNIKVVELLLLRHASVHETNNNDETALHIAACYDQLDIVEVLLQHGADLNAVNSDGHTALDMAQSRNYKAVEQRLYDELKKLENDAMNANSSDLAIVKSRQELEKVMNDSAAEPTELSLSYIERCTYHYRDLLGEGAFGEVYLGVDDVLGIQFAVKRIPLVVSNENLGKITKSFKREILVCFLCKNFEPPHILKSKKACVFVGSQALQSSKYYKTVWVQHQCPYIAAMSCNGTGYAWNFRQVPLQ